MVRILLGAVGFAVLLALPGWGTALADGRDDGRKPCGWLVGTYLTTNEDSTGAFASRSLISFHVGGTVTVVDSRESAGVSGDAFSSQVGSYRCEGRHRALATTVDFGFPPDADIGRLDWSVRARRDGTIAGQMRLTLLTPLATCNPFDADETCTLEAQADFSFTGVPVPARAD